MDFELWHFPHSSDLKRATAEPLGQCADGMVDKSHLPQEGLQVKERAPATGWTVRHCHKLLLCPSLFFSFVWCTALSIVLKMHWYAWSIVGGMQHWSFLPTGVLFLEMYWYENDTRISYKSKTHMGATLTSSSHLLCCWLTFLCF